HERQGRGVRAGGEPAAGADAGLLRPGLDHAGGGDRVPHAGGRDPGRRAQAAAREEARIGAGEGAGEEGGGGGQRCAARRGRALSERKRLRELGVSLGRYPTGPLNAITDVAGVRVGHTTLIAGEGKLTVGKGPVRTGVTAIIPFENFFLERAI